MSPLTKSVTTITVYAVITRMLGFFFRIYLVAVLGAQLLGVYQVAFSFFVVLVGVVASGVPLIVSTYTARAPSDKRYGSGVAMSGFLVSLVITAVTAVLVLCCKTPISLLFADERSYTVLLMLLPALVFSGLTASARGSVWGRRHYKAVSVIELAEQVSRIVACVVMFTACPLLLSNQADLAGLAMSIGCGVSGLALVVTFFMDGYRIAKPVDLKPLIKTSTPISVVRVASSAINLLIAIFVPKLLISSGYSPETAMTLYGESVGMGLSLIFIPLTLTGSLAMALVPELADNMQTSSCKHVRNLCTKGLNFAVLSTGLFVPVFLSLGDPIGMLFFDSSRCGDFLVKGAFIMIPLGLEQIGSSMMNSLGLEKPAFINFLIGTAVLLGVLWVGTPYLGIDALALAMFCSYSVSMLLHTVVLRQRLSMPLSYLVTLAKVLASVLPSALLGFFVYNLIRPLGVLWAPLLSGIVILASTVLGYLLTGAVQAESFRLRLKRFTHRKA